MEICWDRAAGAWDTHRTAIEDMKAEVTELLLASVQPLQGQRVLELGGGTGELAARLAEAVGPTGSLVASDLAGGMVELQEKRLASYPQVEVTTVDAAAIELPTASFDVVVFRMGLMMVPEPEQALEGIRRVLRPGGTFVTAVWGAPHENPWLSAVGMAAAMAGLVDGGPPAGPGGPFSLTDPADLERRVRSAGFGDVTVEVVRKSRRYRDAAHQVAEIGALSPGLAEPLAAATPEQLAQVVAGVEGLTAPYRTGAGLEVPATSLLCTAR